MRRDALAIFDEALKAADARQAVLRYMRQLPGRLEVGDRSFFSESFDRVLLLAVGKAAVPMAQAIEEICGGNLYACLVVTRYGHAGDRLQACRVLEAGHPIPDAAGIRAAKAVKDFVGGLTARDILVVAVSGGASALLPAPPPTITLADKQQTTGMLLRAGADIHQLNIVRKQLSMLKGGRLAALAFPATVVGLLLSDVIGDDIATIGSGLTAADPATPAEALSVLARFDLLAQVPSSVRTFLEARQTEPATGWKANVHNVVVGSNGLALQAAAGKAQELGYRAEIEPSPMQGEARTVALERIAAVRRTAASSFGTGPSCWLSGGETTVTVQGNGKGGRNQEFALAAALAIAGEPNLLVLSAGTDGTDGPTDAAGAIASGTTVQRGYELGLDAADFLRRNDSYRFFDSLGDLVRTGPTGTNVMDLSLVLAR